MRLAEEGIVALDAPISAWFPKLPHAECITVRQLVNHRSGMPEFELQPGDEIRVGSTLLHVDLCTSDDTVKEMG